MLTKSLLLFSLVAATLAIPLRTKLDTALISEDSDDGFKGDFFCYENDNLDAGLPELYKDNEMPTLLKSVPNDGKTHLCCASIVLHVDESTPLYFVKAFTVDERDQTLLHALKKTNAGCFKDDDDFVTCCCTQSKCNNINFIRYNYDTIQYAGNTNRMFNGNEGVYGLCVVVVTAIILLFIYVISYFTCISRFTAKKAMELPAMKNVDFRGITIQPYTTPAEVESIIKGIQTARSSHLSEPSNFKKIHFRSVTTFSTIDDLTIREPAPVQLPTLSSHNPCMDMLQHLIKTGPKEIKFDADALLACYDQALKVLKREPTLQEATLPIMVYADLHGQYSDLIRWFHLNGWPPTTRCIFLGDYVDRGRHSLELITLLLCLKAVMPYDVFLNRGNHEDAFISRYYSFYAEVINRLPSNANLNQKVFDKLAECFAYLPLATRLNGKIMCMHGGLSPKLECWENIAEIKRPIYNLSANTLACDLAWSDPSRKTSEYLVNFKRDKKKGIGFMFGLRQVESVCKALEIHFIVRGHQAPMNGYELFGPKMCTLFSAPGYRGVDNEPNFGASMHIDSHGNIDIIRIAVTNVVRRERNRQKLDKGEGYLDWSQIKDKPLDDDDERSC